MRRPHLALPMLLALAACQQRETPTPEQEQPGAEPAQVASPSLLAPKPVAPSVDRKISETSSQSEFGYTYPAAASAIPALRAFLEADIAKQRGALAAGVKTAQAEAKENGFEFRGHARSSAWQVVAELPGWLSLSATHDSYEGGAHPNHWFDALLWDKAAGKRREAVDLFSSKQALSQAIRKDFCAAINKQRAEKRGAPVKLGGDEMFTECIDPVAQTVLLGSSDRKAFNRIGVLVAPYEAGPYAEGDYEVTLPVTDAVLKVVKPEYRAAFAAAR